MGLGRKINLALILGTDWFSEFFLEEPPRTEPQRSPEYGPSRPPVSSKITCIMEQWAKQNIGHTILTGACFMEEKGWGVGHALF